MEIRNIQPGNEIGTGLECIDYVEEVEFCCTGSEETVVKSMKTTMATCNPEDIRS